ncbi:hypothetical protein QTP70_023867, partial [Hemibagrus guttatus]
GKMGKRKDLSEFDKGQIVMARPLDQNISKTAVLVGCSWSAVVRIYQKWSKEGTEVKGGCVSLTWAPYGTRKHYWKKAIMLWAMFCWETLGSSIHVDATLTCTTYLSIVADHVHPFMKTVFPDGCGLFPQENVPCHKAKMVQEWIDERNNGFEVLTLVSKFPRSQSNRASVGCTGQTSPIHGVPTSQLAGLKGSAANILVPDTTAHLQGSGVHALMGQGCFGSKRRTNTILVRRS